MVAVLCVVICGITHHIRLCALCVSVLFWQSCSLDQSPIFFMRMLPTTVIFNICPCLLNPFIRLLQKKMTTAMITTTILATTTEIIAAPATIVSTVSSKRAFCHYGKIPRMLPVDVGLHVNTWNQIFSIIIGKI